MYSRYILALAGRAIPLAAALMASMYANQPHYKVASYIGAILILAVTEYYAVFRPYKSLRDVREKLLDGFFKQWIDTATINGRRPKLRINVMLKRFPPTRLFRPTFVQFYQLGMAGYPDANLVFSIDKGFGGKVFRKKRQEANYRDLRDLSATDQIREFGWSDAEIEMLQGVTSVVSVPLFRSTRTWGGAPRQISIGLLNVDSLDADGASFLAQETTLNYITGLARVVQSAFEV